MAEILETAMLICFGLFWPLNVYKNIKARTAKSMSLQFILLIIVGYVAGITAKLLNHRINYVLVVYIINLVIVSINVFVYFINKKHDREAEELKQEMNGSTEAFAVTASVQVEELLRKV